MERHPTVLAAFALTTRHRLRHMSVPATWSEECALAPFASLSEVVAAALPPRPPAERRPVLRSLLRMAARDRVASEVLMCALVPGLRAAAAELARWAPAERAEVDALLAAAGWEAITALAGTAQPWADRVLLGRARDKARAALRSEFRRRRREEARDEVVTPPTVAGDVCLDRVVVATMLRSAIDRGVVTRSAAGIVWALRAEGRTTSELARLAGKSSDALSMERLRAERALRAAVA